MNMFCSLKYEKSGISFVPLSIAFLCEGNSFYAEFIDNLDFESLPQSSIPVYKACLFKTGVSGITETTTGESWVFFENIPTIFGRMREFFKLFEDNEITLVVDKSIEDCFIRMMLMNATVSAFLSDEVISISSIIADRYGIDFKSADSFPRELILSNSMSKSENALGSATNLRVVYRELMKETNRDYAIRTMFEKMAEVAGRLVQNECWNYTEPFFVSELPVRLNLKGNSPDTDFELTVSGKETFISPVAILNALISKTWRPGARFLFSRHVSGSNRDILRVYFSEGECLDASLQEKEMEKDMALD